MSDQLLLAIINLITKVGIDGAIAFLERPMATVDDAIAALKRAKEKSLADYIAEDQASRGFVVTPVTPGEPSVEPPINPA